MKVKFKMRWHVIYITLPNFDTSDVKGLGGLFNEELGI